MITELTKKFKDLETTKFIIRDCLDNHLSMVRIPGQENNHLTSDFEEKQTNKKVFPLRLQFTTHKGSRVDKVFIWFSKYT